MAKNPRFGSSFDDWLKEEGIYDEVMTRAMARVREWQKQRFRYLLRKLEVEREGKKVQ